MKLLGVALIVGGTLTLLFNGICTRLTMVLREKVGVFVYRSPRFARIVSIAISLAWIGEGRHLVLKY
ncbi:MAG TPA: hypothetical protein VHK65_06400 [Candidatus Dormibacteraeota bacterium]|nr:hypothetical protein [Candidatus Dormibacteraeota bacterium]